MAAPNEAGYDALSSANVQQKVQSGDFQGAIQTARSELNDKIKGKTDSLVSSHQGLTASNQGLANINQGLTASNQGLVNVNQGIVDAIKQSSPPPDPSGPANNSSGSGKPVSK